MLTNYKIAVEQNKKYYVNWCKPFTDPYCRTDRWVKLKDGRIGLFSSANVDKVLCRFPVQCLKTSFRCHLQVISHEEYREGLQRFNKEVKNIMEETH